MLLLPQARGAPHERHLVARARPALSWPMANQDAQPAPSPPAAAPAAQVDQFFGANEQQLRDHMWLWAQQEGSGQGGPG